MKTSESAETFPANTGLIEIWVEKMVYGGEGLARTPEGVVLVAGLLPGERAMVRLLPAKRGVRRGELVRLLEASPDRFPPECPYFGRCGGCQHQGLAYPRQLEIKRQILEESFRRLGRIELDVPLQVVPSVPWGYRNRVRLHVRKEATEFRVGYRAASSQDICGVDRCPISSPALEQIIGQLSAGALADEFPIGTFELELLAVDSDRALLATVYSTVEASADFGEKWMAQFPLFQSVCWRREPAGGDAIWGTGAVTYRVGDYHYRLSHHSFFQPNRYLPERMIEVAVAGLSGRRALDLFAGVGFFTLPLARQFESVTAVEADPCAARDLATNTGVAGTRVQVYRKTAEGFLSLAASSPPWDAVIVDPPRRGLSLAVRQHLLRLQPRQLVYVSCDPATLCRDIAALLRASYRIRSVHLVDQFPQTFHLESVVQLELLA